MSKKPPRKIHNFSPSDHTENVSQLNQENCGSVGDQEKFSRHQETQPPHDGDEPVEDLEDEEIYNPVEILRSYIYAVLGAPTDSFVQKPDQAEEPGKAAAGEAAWRLCQEARS